MSGKTELFRAAVIVISLIAAGSDLVQGKIYNALTMPALLLGMVFSFWSMGWAGLLGSVLGVVLGLLLYGWMFWIGFMGGGDVKLLMALGAWGGVTYVLETGLAAIFVGGAMAALILLFKGKIPNFVKKMRMSLMSLLVKQMEFVPPKIDHQMTMPYGIPIAIAAIWAAYGSPLAMLGLKLW